MTELKKKAHKSWENDTTVSGASMPNKIYEAGYIAGATETTKELQEELDYAKSNCLFSDCDRVVRLKSQNEDLEKENARLKIKAKEIIREYMRFESMIGTCSFYSEEYEKTKKKAEAFLKE